MACSSGHSWAGLVSQGTLSPAAACVVPPLRHGTGRHEASSAGAEPCCELGELCVAVLLSLPAGHAEHHCEGAPLCWALAHSGCCAVWKCSSIFRTPGSWAWAACSVSCPGAAPPPSDTVPFLVGDVLLACGSLPFPRQNSPGCCLGPMWSVVCGCSGVLLLSSHTQVSPEPC